MPQSVYVNCASVKATGPLSLLNCKPGPVCCHLLYGGFCPLKFICRAPNPLPWHTAFLVAGQLQVQLVQPQSLGGPCSDGTGGVRTQRGRRDRCPQGGRGPPGQGEKRSPRGDVGPRSVLGSYAHTHTVRVCQGWPPRATRHSDKRRSNLVPGEGALCPALPVRGQSSAALKFGSKLRTWMLFPQSGLFRWFLCSEMPRVGHPQGEMSLQIGHPARQVVAGDGGHASPLTFSAENKPVSGAGGLHILHTAPGLS